MPMQFILEHFIELIFTALGGLLTAAYRSLAKRLRDREAESAALKEGGLSVLHDRLYQECDRYIQKGTIDASGLKNIEHLYESYHALGGNGTGSELYRRAKALPIKQEDRPMMNKKVPAATIARTVVLALALVNQLLSAAGKPVLPIDSASVEQWVTAGLTTAAAIWAWWENNSFTPEAIHADELLDQMQGKK